MWTPSAPREATVKRLILCCDGTWNRADQVTQDGKPCVTNVLKIARRIAKSAGGTPQIIYYGQGVGTGNALDRFSGGAFGEGLTENIFDAYRFLVANYEPNDELFLFGFSRGAFTARSIAGMIRKCGILRRDFAEQYVEAIQLYKNGAHPDDAGPKDFRSRFSLCGLTGIPIKFIGVWDTVGALGIPLRGLRSLTRKDYQFHDTQLSGTVEYAFHALAIDEHRAPFKPTLWACDPKHSQTVEQVWFSGVHSDIGGGYPEAGHSDITLDWMIGKARSAGLVFDQAVLDARRLQPEPLQDLHNSKKGLYNLSRGIDRPIGWAMKDPDRPNEPDRNDPTQSVHDSVRARWDAQGSKYRPATLEDYFKRIGDPRGT
jgi:uncharacterized protein (DUF2235 family)